MKRRTLIAWFGFLVIVVPFLGVPIQWKEYALIALGVSIIIVSISGPRKRIERSESGSPAFIENQVTENSGKKI
jgi:hypothetical protein